jgi:DNA-binding GntR family transcriptional regulator
VKKTAAGRAGVAGMLRLGPYVHGAVKERLLEGEWKAGEFLPVEGLKLEFGTSKQPIMEAMRLLVADGLVEIVPQVGCRVPAYSTDEVTDFFTVFASLEAETAAVAARRRTDQQLGELSEINAKIGLLTSVASAMDRVRQYRALNRDFHQVILEMTHSEILMRTSTRMWDMSDLLINGSELGLPLSDDVAARYEEHERLIVTFEQHNSVGAREAMRDHITRNIAMLNAIHGVDSRRS